MQNPPQYSRYAFSLLMKLLQPNPEKRLSMEQAMKHPFFKLDQSIKFKKVSGRFQSMLMQNPLNKREESAHFHHQGTILQK